MFTLVFLLYLRRAGGGGECTPGVRVWVRSLCFTRPKCVIFPTLFLIWTTVLKKRNEKRLTQLQTLYQRKRKKNMQYFWPKRLKTIPILTISSQKPYYLGGGLFTPKIGEIMRSLCGREPIMLGRWNLLMIICLSRIMIISSLDAGW